MHVEPIGWVRPSRVEPVDVELAFERARTTAAVLGGGIEPLGERPWGRVDFRLVDPDGYYVRVTS